MASINEAKPSSIALPYPRHAKHAPYEKIKPPTAEFLVKLSDHGKSISAFFTNIGNMIPESTADANLKRRVATGEFDKRIANALTQQQPVPRARSEIDDSSGNAAFWKDYDALPASSSNAPTSNSPCSSSTPHTHRCT